MSKKFYRPSVKVLGKDQDSIPIRTLTSEMDSRTFIADDSVNHVARDSRDRIITQSDHNNTRKRPTVRVSMADLRVTSEFSHRFNEYVPSAIHSVL